MAPLEMGYDHVQGARQEGSLVTLLPTCSRHFSCSHHPTDQSLYWGCLIQGQFSFEALLLITGTTVCK